MHMGVAGNNHLNLYLCLGFQQHTSSRVKLVWSHLGIVVCVGSPSFVCSMGLPLNLVAGGELYFVEEAENGPAFMLHLKPNPIKSWPL